MQFWFLMMEIWRTLAQLGFTLGAFILKILFDFDNSHIATADTAVQETPQEDGRR